MEGKERFCSLPREPRAEGSQVGKECVLAVVGIRSRLI